MAYTWAEFTTYLRLARGRKARERADELVLTNLAMNGGDATNELLRKLRRAADEAGA